MLKKYTSETKEKIKQNFLKKRQRNQNLTGDKMKLKYIIISLN